MKDVVVPVLIAVGVCTLIGVGIWWEMSLWSECRADHTWYYCMRILNK